LGGNLWNNYFDFETKRMEQWEKIAPIFKYNKATPFFEILVPTIDTVRFGYLLDKLLSVGQSMLLTGNSGVGKVSWLHITHSSFMSRVFWNIVLVG